VNRCSQFSRFIMVLKGVEDTPLIMFHLVIVFRLDLGVVLELVGLLAPTFSC
jgi:hypothetical protein